MESISMMTTIPFQWSYSVIIITLFVVIIIAVSLCLILFVSKYQIWFKLLFLTICTLCILFGLYYTPISIKVDKKCLVINSLLKETIISKDSITDIVLMPNNIINESRRIFGSGGCFGYLGTFRNDKLGKFQLYATEKNNLIFIRTSSVNYLVSCKGINILVQYGYEIN